MNKVARIINGEVVYSDDAASVLKPTETAARESREDQRVRFRKETLQKNQMDYWRVYKDQAKQLPDDLRRLLS